MTFLPRKKIEKLSITEALLDINHQLIVSLNKRHNDAKATKEDKSSTSRVEAALLATSKALFACDSIIKYSDSKPTENDKTACAGVYAPTGNRGVPGLCNKYCTGKLYSLEGKEIVSEEEAALHHKKDTVFRICSCSQEEYDDMLYHTRRINELNRSRNFIINEQSRSTILHQ